MMNILTRALTVSLLYTLVCSASQSSSPWNDGSRLNCEKQDDGVTVCPDLEDSNSACNKGISLPEEQYRECILSSEICDAPGTFRIRKVPSRYYTCILNHRNGSFEKETETCERGKVFDSRTLQCLTTNELSISRSIPEKSDDPLPLCENMETIPDSVDCKSFYVCSEHKSLPTKMYCGPGMYFNEESKMCTDFMTKTCIMKLSYWENLNRDRARKHYAALQEIIVNKIEEPQANSGESDPADNIVQREERVYSYEQPELPNVKPYDIFPRGSYVGENPEQKSRLTNQRGFVRKTNKLKAHNNSGKLIQEMNDMSWELKDRPPQESPEKPGSGRHGLKPKLIRPAFKQGKTSQKFLEPNENLRQGIQTRPDSRPLIKKYGQDSTYEMQSPNTPSVDENFNEDHKRRHSDSRTGILSMPHKVHEDIHQKLEAHSHARRGILTLPHNVRENLHHKRSRRHSENVDIGSLHQNVRENLHHKRRGHSDNLLDITSFHNNVRENSHHKRRGHSDNLLDITSFHNNVRENLHHKRRGHSDNLLDITSFHNNVREKLHHKRGRHSDNLLDNGSFHNSVREKLHHKRGRHSDNLLDNGSFHNSVREKLHHKRRRHSDIGSLSEKVNENSHHKRRMSHHSDARPGFSSLTKKFNVILRFKTRRHSDNFPHKLHRNVHQKLERHSHARRGALSLAHKMREKLHHNWEPSGNLPDIIGSLIENLNEDSYRERRGPSVIFSGIHSLPHKFHKDIHRKLKGHSHARRGVLSRGHEMREKLHHNWKHTEDDIPDIPSLTENVNEHLRTLAPLQLDQPDTYNPYTSLTLTHSKPHSQEEDSDTQTLNSDIE